MSCSTFALLPAFAVFLGQLDHEHDVSLTVSDGQMEVRFHHAGEHSPDAIPKDPTLQTNGGDSHDDHVMKFASGGDTFLSQRSIVSGQQIQPIALPASRSWCSLVRLHTTVGQARPPPHRATAAVCLRSVILLV